MDGFEECISPRSTETQRPVDRISFRGKASRHLNSWQTEECINPVRGLRDWQKRSQASSNTSLRLFVQGQKVLGKTSAHHKEASST